MTAVLLTNTVIGSCWLIADPDVLADHPDIAGSGVPAFLFGELRHLQCLSPADLQKIASVKRIFPTSTVIQ